MIVILVAFMKLRGRNELPLDNNEKTLRLPRSSRFFNSDDYLIKHIQLAIFNRGHSKLPLLDIDCTTKVSALGSVV